MLWLAVFLPRLPTEALPGCIGTDAPPLAVCDRLVVLQANEAAQARGVHPGLKRATALAIAPELRLVERDRVREHEALRQLACWALQFTPSVSLQTGSTDLGPAAPTPAGSPPAPLGLLLEVEPSLRLFGGRDALLQRLRSGLAGLGFTARVACAPVAGGAWLLARHRDGLHADTIDRLHGWLAALPLALLESAQPHLDSLASVGMRTMADLRRLPRAGLARRFGPGLLAELDRAFGSRPEPRLWFEAPASFDARLELMAETASTETLLFAAQRLVLQLTGWLKARHAGTCAFDLHAEHDTPPGSLFPVRLAGASRDPARLLGVLRETVSAARLRAPVHTLRLYCDGCAALPPASDDLFPMPASACEGLARLIERLQARLGREQVQRLRLHADHRPEAAYRFETLDGPPAPGRTAIAPPPVGLPRPLWLQAQPSALAERGGNPWANSRLSLLAGPERIETGWWDGAPIQRDYFIAADDSGRLLWIFRARLSDPPDKAGWFVHGRFG